VALGGYASEKLVFGELTTGAADDLKRATDIARSLVVRYGMSEKVGPISLVGENGLIFLGKELGADKDYSEETASLVDSEVGKFLNEAYAQAKDILEKNREALDTIASELMKKESIERDEFEKLMKKFRTDV
ncbi:cell division protein FtsH, partial [Patescibacteria group bacterium]|nr:cell division protein FtsH [Patescibacteria group bacterium]